MTITEINELTIVTEKDLLIQRIGKPEEEISLDEMEEELDLYKVELTAQEDARLAEIARQEELARKQDFTNRLNSIPDLRLALHNAGLNIPNMALECKRIIEENDLERLQLLESIDVMQDIRSQKVDELRGLRNLLLAEADHAINILEDASQDASSYRAYRQSLRDITDQFKDDQGNYTDSVDNLNITLFQFPNKPS